MKGLSQHTEEVVAKYAGRRIMLITPNEAKRLGVWRIQILPINPAKGLNIRPLQGRMRGMAEFLSPNRFASLGVIHVQDLRSYF